MEKLIVYLEKKIEGCNELGGMEKEKWAFIQCLKEARKQVLNLPVVMPRILDFKNTEGINIDPDWVELIYENGEFKFYETDCHQKIQEVFPVYEA